MRRGTDVTNNTLAIGPLELDLKSRKCIANGKELALLPKEFAVLELLMKYPGQIFSSDALLNRVWSSESSSTEHSVRTYMHTLRKKLMSAECDVLRTVHGVGYKLDIGTQTSVGRQHD